MNGTTRQEQFSVDLRQHPRLRVRPRSSVPSPVSAWPNGLVAELMGSVLCSMSR